MCQKTTLLAHLRVMPLCALEAYSSELRQHSIGLKNQDTRGRKAQVESIIRTREELAPAPIESTITTPPQRLPGADGDPVVVDVDAMFDDSDDAAAAPVTGSAPVPAPVPAPVLVAAPARAAETFPVPEPVPVPAISATPPQHEEAVLVPVATEAATAPEPEPVPEPEPTLAKVDDIDDVDIPEAAPAPDGALSGKKRVPDEVPQENKDVDAARPTKKPRFSRKEIEKKRAVKAEKRAAKQARRDAKAKRVEARTAGKKKKKTIAVDDDVTMDATKTDEAKPEPEPEPKPEPEPIPEAETPVGVEDATTTEADVPEAAEAEEEAAPAPAAAPKVRISREEVAARRQRKARRAHKIGLRAKKTKRRRSQALAKFSDVATTSTLARNLPKKDRANDKDSSGDHTDELTFHDLPDVQQDDDSCVVSDDHESFESDFEQSVAQDNAEYKKAKVVQSSSDDEDMSARDRIKHRSVKATKKAHARMLMDDGDDFDDGDDAGDDDASEPAMTPNPHVNPEAMRLPSTPTLGILMKNATNASAVLENAKEAGTAGLMSDTYAVLEQNGDAKDNAECADGKVKPKPEPKPKAKPEPEPEPEPKQQRARLRLGPYLHACIALCRKVKVPPDSWEEARRGLDDAVVASVVAGMFDTDLGTLQPAWATSLGTDLDGNLERLQLSEPENLKLVQSSFIMNAITGKKENHCVDYTFAVQMPSVKIGPVESKARDDAPPQTSQRLIAFLLQPVK